MGADVVCAVCGLGFRAWGFRVWGFEPCLVLYSNPAPAASFSQSSIMFNPRV